LPYILLLQLSKKKEIFISSLLQYILYTTIKQFRALVKIVLKRVDDAYARGDGRLVWIYIKEHKKAAVKDLKLWVIDNVGFFKALFIKRKYRAKTLTRLPIRRRYLEPHDIYKLVLGLPEYYAPLKDLVDLAWLKTVKYTPEVADPSRKREPKPKAEFVPTIILETPKIKTFNPRGRVDSVV
jgi:hypothetical protein